MNTRSPSRPTLGDVYRVIMSLLDSKPQHWGLFPPAQVHCREGSEAHRGCRLLPHACMGVKCGTLTRRLSYPSPERRVQKQQQQHVPCLSSVTSPLGREEAHTVRRGARDVIIHSLFATEKCLGSVLGCFCLQAIHLKSKQGWKWGWGMGVGVRGLS